MVYFAGMSTKVKILIIRFSSIGDIVLTTPVIRCLKKQIHGEAELHYLTKKAYVDLLKNNPYLDKIHSIEKTTNEVIDQLIAEEFDYVVDLHKNLRSLRVKKKLKALSFSFEKLNFDKWLLVNLKINRMPKKHIVDRYLESVAPLGIVNDGEGLDYFLPENIDREILLSPPFQQGYVALVLGANHATKKLPEEKWQEVISGIAKPMILIGGKEDASLGARLAQLNPAIVMNAAGKMNLNQSAYLIREAESVITPDTGMMHIAAAFQKKIISIWGNTVPDFGMYPYLKKHSNGESIVLEEKGLSCRPCSKIGFDKCPKGHFNCMNQQDFKKVIALVND
jgi:ADP-heptose:LPS heptosyltransferase